MLGLCVVSYFCFGIRIFKDTMAKDEELPDVTTAREFYAKYVPKEVLGKYVHIN